MTSWQPTAALGEASKHFCGPVAIVGRPQIVLRQGFSSNKNINLIYCPALVPLLHLWPNFCRAPFWGVIIVLFGIVFASVEGPVESRSRNRRLKWRATRFVRTMRFV